MSTTTRFEDLEIWQLSREMYRRISTIASHLREKREYRFSEQIESSSGSVMDNIAEGFERNSRLEFLHSLRISKGESGEMKSQIYRLPDDKYISQQEFEELYQCSDKLSGKIANFVRYLNTSDVKGLKFNGRV